jgi:alcohol dehydrogenase class IV
MICSSTSEPPHQQVWCHAGARFRLREIVGDLDPASVLLVASDRGAERSDIARDLTTRGVPRFGAFTSNPRLDAVLACAREVEERQPAVVVALGGGSTMDVAKAGRLLPVDREPAVAALRGGDVALRTKRPALVVVPTTAGSGSEVTRFAAVYVDGVKHSLDHDRARADVALCDPDLTASCPAATAAATALDGLAQGIESMLARRGTAASRANALASGPGFLAVTAEQGRVAATERAQAMQASLLVGRAIDVGRTTVGHAFAYPTTVRYGVAHGLAAALHLVWILPLIVARVSGDPVLAARLDLAARVVSADGRSDLGAAVARAIAAAGFSARLADHGVRSEDVGDLVDAALGSERAGNCIVSLERAEACRGLEAALA